ncbi:MAG: right-handed parallel beta-helix repeat-containing protein [Calditrichaeota bacterium]|nr:right-handed parallel beta-helix repeat-containing protein [Calditrichota bacterium]
MKHRTASLLWRLFFVLFIAFQTSPTLAVVIDGYCYLEGESDHSGTKVKFLQADRMLAVDSVYTNPSGHFNLELTAGTYDVQYSHGSFASITASAQRLARDTTLVPHALALAATRISGRLSGTLGPGVFRITGDISVDTSDTLRLMPGTIFFFAKPSLFTIRGTLIAEGQASDSIVFTTNIHRSRPRWSGLRFMGAHSSGSRLSYCVIENASSRTGGIYCRASSPAFAHCSVRHNSSRWGGGVLCQSASPTFTNCYISANQAKYGGGAVYGRLSAMTFQHCTIRGNSASFYGGGVYGRRSSLVFTDCAIVGNSTGWYGGGVYCGDSSVSFGDCVITGNSAAHAGDGIYRRNSSVSLKNCALQ